MLERIEGYNADRIIELPRHEIGDDSFEVCPRDLGFAVNGAQCAYRKSSPSILVMQSTQDCAAPNASRCLGGT
jgi:hypothetical protein